MISLLVYELRAELQRKLAGPMEFIAENVAALVFLCIAMAGAGRLPDAAGGGVGFASRFLLAFFCMGAVQTVPRLVTDEPGAAILEQLCMSRIPLWRLALVRDVAGAILFVPMAAVLAAAACAITRVRMTLPPAGALFPIVMMRVGMLGPGFALGAIALLNRRAGPLINLASAAMLALAFAAPHQAGGGYIALAFPYTAWQLPLLAASGTTWAGQVSIEWHVLLACVASIVYLAAGIAMFNRAFTRAMTIGALVRW